VVCSIESQTLRYWQMTTGNEVSVRDLQMAENLIWLAEKAYPGKKIIVWAHNGHIAKSLTSVGAGGRGNVGAAGTPAKTARVDVGLSRGVGGMARSLRWALCYQRCVSG
jgi:hypothetical protein